MYQYCITIFTPTFNRANLLPQLYESLLNQSFKDFEWIIIDDGSVDNTRTTVDKFIEQNKIKISYIYKSNGGKHRAINDAVKIAKGDLFFIVDSDDYLACIALERIMFHWKNVNGDLSFAGVAGLKGYNEHENIGTSVLGDYLDASSLELRDKYKIKGDKSEVFKTDILKKYPFPEIEDEYFMSEGIVWYKIANEGYKIRWFNEIIYIAEYREDGLSFNAFKIALENWKGIVLCNNSYLLFKLPLKKKLKCSIDYYRYGFWGKVNLVRLFLDNNGKIYSVVGIPLGFLKLFYTFYKIKKLKINL